MRVRRRADAGRITAAIAIWARTGSIRWQSDGGTMMEAREQIGNAAGNRTVRLKAILPP